MRRVVWEIADVDYEELCDIYQSLPWLQQAAVKEIVERSTQLITDVG